MDSGDLQTAKNELKAPGARRLRAGNARSRSSTNGGAALLSNGAYQPDRFRLFGTACSPSKAALDAARQREPANVERES